MEMRDVKDLPLRGYVYLEVTFQDYVSSIQNDTRRQLGEQLPPKVRANFPNSEFNPEIFSLLKRVSGKTSRAYGASHIYKYKVKDNENISKLIKYIYHDWYKNNKVAKYWKDMEIFFFERIGGI